MPAPKVSKRQKETERTRRRQEKEARRAQRRVERGARVARALSAPDPDLAGIVPGPQPPAP